jgi:hypothetical protein
VYYNANEQTPDKLDSKSKTQAKIGWDTLNWDPAFATPEWGNTPVTSAAKWPWDLFDKDVTFNASSHVKLNWQAKLMPVTSGRFNEAAKGSLLNSKIRSNIIKAVLFFDRMVTH